MNLKKAVSFIAGVFCLPLGFCLELNKTYYLCYDLEAVSVKEKQIEFYIGGKDGFRTWKIEEGLLNAGKYFDTFTTECGKYILLSCATDSFAFLTLVKKFGGSEEQFLYTPFPLRDGQTPPSDEPKARFSYTPMPYAYLIKRDINSMPLLVGFDVVSASSRIVEPDGNGGNIEYLPKVFNFDDNPWAVSAESKDKSIVLNISERKLYEDRRLPRFPVNEIIIANGFISPDKEHLYLQNSRARNIRITYGDASFVTELKDTGNYQVIKLPKTFETFGTERDFSSKGEMKIEILDFYPGSKYSDVVISAIMYIRKCS